MATAPIKDVKWGGFPHENKFVALTLDNKLHLFGTGYVYRGEILPSELTRVELISSHQLLIDSGLMPSG